MEKNKSGFVQRRQIYLVDRGFQVRFILRFCGLIALGGLLTVGILYMLGLGSTTVAIVNSRVNVKTTAEFILPLLVQTALLVVILTGCAAAFLTLFLSHKIAGPLYRFKKVLAALEKGDFSRGFKLRRLDHLQDIAGAFNSMIARLTAELVSLKKSFASLKEKINNISEHEIAENKRAYFAELKKITEELNRIIDYFKT